VRIPVQFARANSPEYPPLSTESAICGLPKTSGGKGNPSVLTIRYLLDVKIIDAHTIGGGDGPVEGVVNSLQLRNGTFSVYGIGFG
jgi:hypothetical protein